MPARNQTGTDNPSTRNNELTQNEELQSWNKIPSTYNELKQFEGKKYMGMKVGGTHKWYYDKGEWKEKKLAPDKWEFNYAVTKRRACSRRLWCSCWNRISLVHSCSSECQKTGREQLFYINDWARVHVRT
jgi:hypothetical protein